MSHDQELKPFNERQRENKYPIQFALYKGVTGKLGAMRMSLKKAYADPNNTDPKKFPGVIFMDMAPATGPNQYDWENGKIKIALSITDISKIILYLRAPGHSIHKDGKLRIFHDMGAGSAERGKTVKTLEINKQSDRNNFFISLYQKSADGSRNATCTISPDEAITMGTLLQEAIPQILAWA